MDSIHHSINRLRPPIRLLGILPNQLSSWASRDRRRGLDRATCRCDDSISFSPRLLFPFFVDENNSPIGKLSSNWPRVGALVLFCFSFFLFKLNTFIFLRYGQGRFHSVLFTSQKPKLKKKDSNFLAVPAVFIQFNSLTRIGRVCGIPNRWRLTRKEMVLIPSYCFTLFGPSS